MRRSKRRLDERFCRNASTELGTTESAVANDDQGAGESGYARTLEGPYRARASITQRSRRPAWLAFRGRCSSGAAAERGVRRTRVERGRQSSNQRPRFGSRDRASMTTHGHQQPERTTEPGGEQRVRLRGSTAVAAVEPVIGEARRGADDHADMGTRARGSLDRSAIRGMYHIAPSPARVNPSPRAGGSRGNVCELRHSRAVPRAYVPADARFSPGGDAGCW